MVTADHPDIPFVEAKTADGGPAYTRGRPDGPPIWVVIHDMEFPERLDAAEWTAHYFSGPASAAGRSVSSHYTADADSIVQCVRLADTAWTVGNRPGNYRGINWELAGYASQTRQQWLDTFSLAMLTRIAEIIRRDMGTYSIPARTLSDAQVKAFTSGITSHWQLGRVFGGTDHTDPGPNFPWDVLLDLLTGDDDVAISENDFNALIWRVKAILDNTATVTGGPTKGEKNQLHDAVADEKVRVIVREELDKTEGKTKLGLAP
jgi:hypothetical protein